MSGKAFPTFCLALVLAASVVQPQEEEDKVLLVMGGYNNLASIEEYLDDVETVDIFQGRCSDFQQDLPFPASHQVGLTFDSEGNSPMFCGPSQQPEQCWILEEGRWRRGPDLTVPRGEDSRVLQLSDGRFFVYGSYLATYNNKTEFLDPSGAGDGEFVPGPDLPFNSRGACAAELEPGKLLVTGGEGDYLRLSYFFVLDSGDFELTSSDLPSDRTNHRCSVVETEERGAEIVLAGGNNGFATNGVLETVDIFDPREGLYRPGPSLPFPVDNAQSVPYKNSFLMVGGGSDYPYYFLPSILEYDAEGEGWIRRLEELQLPRKFHALTWVERSVYC